VLQNHSRNWIVEGSTNPSVIAAGHSHILSMLGGLHSSAELQQLPLAVQYSLDSTIWPNISHEYWEQLRELPFVETVVICWNGNQHNAQFLLESQPAISVYQELSGAEESDNVVVPLSMFDELWMPDFQVLERAIRIVSSTKKAVLTGTPPPKSESEIRNNLSTDEFFVSLLSNAGIKIEDAPITTVVIRFTLWKRIQQNLERIARTTGIAFIPVPSEVFENGMTLKSQYSAPDASHANHLYGQAMWHAALRKIEISV
jgi:hypothetical protein